MFVKSSRLSLFQNFKLGIPLSPEPVITLWVTQNSATLYYAELFEAVEKALWEMDTRDAADRYTSQQLIKSKKSEKFA